PHPPHHCDRPATFRRDLPGLRAALADEHEFIRGRIEHTPGDDVVHASSLGTAAAISATKATAPHHPAMAGKRSHGSPESHSRNAAIATTEAAAVRRLVEVFTPSSPSSCGLFRARCRRAAIAAP